MAKAKSKQFLPNTLLMLLVSILLVSIAILVMLVKNDAESKESATSSSNVKTYAECVKAGGAIAESYPTQCKIDGKSFTNPDQKTSR